MTQFSTLSNCEKNNAMFLAIELQTILEDTERTEIYQKVPIREIYKREIKITNFRRSCDLVATE